MSVQKVAVVTGSNRGIGLSAVKALLKKFNGAVYLTSRNRARGEEALKSLNNEGLHPGMQLLDTADEGSINHLKQYLVSKYGGVDVFIHNAGILFKRDDPTPFAERARATVQTNYHDAVKVCNTFLPIMKSGGRLVVLSSGLSLVALQGCRDDVKSFFTSDDLTEESINLKMAEYVESAQNGTVGENGFDEHAYGMSKLGVNAYIRLLAKRVNKYGQRDILVNCCCPGWVRTSMGGENAPFTPDQGAQIPLMLALLPEGSKEPNGEFYQRRNLVKWYEP